jgi:rhodanese-related sulfurtransferase/DNA-binding transcriptional ArsR family regulator
MQHREFKDLLYAQFATIGQALANPHRLELLDLLAQGERSVEELAEVAALSIANASSHLQVLRRARLVETDKRGVRVYYRLADPQVYELWRTLRDVGSARLAEIDRLVQAYIHDRDSLDAISSAELRQRLDSGDVVVLDVRPAVEYRHGHIPGARSIPVDELQEYLSALSREQTIVAYCRGPYCVYADEAVAALRERGFDALRLDDGLPEWRAAGYPVSVSMNDD